MKRLWQRQRTWFFAVLSGLTTAALLAWWFTPRPEFVVELPELSDALAKEFGYRFVSDHITTRPARAQQQWVPIELATTAMGWPAPTPSLSDEDCVSSVRFVNVRTGKLVRHPGLRSLIPQPEWPIKMLADETTANPLWLDNSGRFLVERRYNLIESVKQIDWFDPETAKSGSIVMPGRQTVSGRCVGNVTPDGSAFIQFRHTDSANIQLTIFDLRTERVTSECRLDLHKPVPANSVARHRLTLPSLKKVMVCRREGWDSRSETAVWDVYTAKSGTFIESFEERDLWNPQWWDERPELQSSLDGSTLVDFDGQQKLLASTKTKDWSIVDEGNAMLWAEDSRLGPPPSSLGIRSALLVSATGEPGHLDS